MLHLDTDIVFFRYVTEASSQKSLKNLEITRKTSLQILNHVV